MKKSLLACYGVLAFLATALAVVLALLFLAALVLGGPSGAALSGFAADVGTWSISVAALAVLVGIVHTYLDGSHSLTAGSAQRTEEPGPADRSDEPDG